MAYQYDAMGNIIGEYESEEERLAREKAEREAAQAQVQKQEIITRADGTQTVKTTQEVSAPVAPTAAPVAQAFPVAEPRQIVAQPISPDQTFNRMVQVESGGRQFDSQGRILTSPKGAQGMAQIMPETARNPGFGVAPATPEEIATPEGNRAFGERYFQGLLKYFNGDVTKATAAYNGGPGRVERNVQANQGQMNVSQLPQETQGYLQKVLGGVVNAVIPSAQAGTLTDEQRRRAPTITQPSAPAPTAPVATAPAPVAAPTPAPTTEAPVGPTGLRIPSFATGITTPPATPDTVAQIDRYQANQDNPLELLKLRADETAAPWMRERAGKRAAELLRQEENKSAAEARAQELAAQAASGDPKASREMARELQNKDGSWVKMILLGFLSPQLAGEEAMKLGFGNKDRTVYDADGNAGLITFRADGKPLNGIKADGTPMSQRELIIYAGGGKRDLDIVGGSYVNDTTGQVGRLVSDKKTGQSYIQTDTGRQPMAGFRPQASTGTLANMRDRAIQEINLKLQGKTEEEKMAILRPYNQQLIAGGYQPVQPSEVGIRPTQIGGGTAPATAPTAPVAPSAVTTPAVPSAPAPTAPAPTTTPPAPTAPAPTGAPTAPSLTGQRPTGPAMEARAAANKAEAQEFVKYDAEDIGPKANAGGSISSIRKAQVKGPDGILNNPELAGILQGQGGAGAEAGNIIRDLITGNFKDEADLSRRVAALNLSQRQKDVLYTQIGLNLQVAPLTLKQNAGAGSVSDAEQKANREANVDILKQPLYSGLTLLTRDQFDKDTAVARSEFKASRPDLDTRSKFDSAWNAEKARISKEYDAIYAARARYIAKYNADGKNPGAVIDAYKYYPVPEYDREKRQWTYGTTYAEQVAKRPPLSSFNR